MVAEVAKASGAPENSRRGIHFRPEARSCRPRRSCRPHCLRQWLRTPDAIVTPGEVEAEAVALLRMVLASAWRQHWSVEPVADDEVESDALPGRPDIVETVKQALARYPAAATSLDDLATYIGMSPSHLARVFSRGRAYRCIRKSDAAAARDGAGADERHLGAHERDRAGRRVFERESFHERLS